jgi:hypothetical protein
MATRKGFNENESAAPAADTPAVARYACMAHRCRMPGTIFMGGSQGQCWLHARENMNDWPRISQVLLDWDMIVDEVLLARRTMIGVYASDPKKQDELKAEAWSRVRGALPLWEAELSPKGIDYGQWGRSLEAFLHARVKEATKGIRA